MQNDLLHSFAFKAKLPESLDYPMYYYPQDIAIEASKHFQEYLKSNPDIHDFNSETRTGESGGKMLGILVVQDENNQVFYLRGFSGKLGGQTDLPGFVPPIYDYEDSENMFLSRSEEIVQVTQEIEQLNSESLTELKTKYQLLVEDFEKQIQEIKQENKLNKKRRDVLRQKASEEELQQLNNQSAQERRVFKQFKKQKEEEIQQLRAELDEFQKEVNRLGEQRKSLSQNLQKDLFKEFILENALGEQNNIFDLYFEQFQSQPPSAIGECAAPKMFQYAIKNKLKPIALAEFWWGTTLKSEVRKHGNFYPCCRSKCEPILPFLLKGLPVEENPLLKKYDFEIDVIFEDDFLMAVNKPSGLLSVRGKTDLYSVQQWIEEKKLATGPGLVHRLDMATSGILLIAKNKEVHEILQKQFLDKTIDKEYTAVLGGVIQEASGIIDFPLRPDLDDRPRQMLCREHGRQAKTEFQVIKIENQRTWIKFYPITGRTHQLRVHAAHPEGLNTAIVGDKLYGVPDKRLHLHASKITFNHPVSKHRISIESESEF